MAGPAIRFDAVGLVLGGVTILENVSFGVAAGTIHCLIGPNGGGKTSLVRSLLGQMPHTGTIAVDWRGGRTIGYVPQTLDFDRTLPLTVADFMALVTEKHRPAFLGTRRVNRARADEALERVGLAGKRKRKLGSLSGGERQRVLFAQALLPPPDLLVLDEPMTSLDELGSGLFARLIRDLADGGVTVLWIAHDLKQVREMAAAVTCVNRTVLFSGPPAEALANLDAGMLFGLTAGGARAAEVAA